MIRLVSVHKTYSLDKTKVQALRGVDVEFHAGQFAALVGPSGCGKSTLLSIAGLIDEPDSGSILYGGRDLARAGDALKTRVRQNEFGFVFQGFHLVPTLNAAENVALPRLLRGDSSRVCLKAARELLSLVGLSELADRNIRSMSGGQRQRVAVARALINSPKAVFADEPTANLDAESATLVIELLVGMCRTRGSALILATHDREIAAAADRIVEIKDGRIGQERRDGATAEAGHRC